MARIMTSSTTTTSSSNILMSTSPPSTARGSARRCGFPACTKTAKTGGLCISHGGGKKCSVDGCSTSVVSRGCCVAHGGGKRCQQPECTKSAQTGGFCWIHGGGKKCGHDGCTKRAQSGGACISHGGGKRCSIHGCNKVVQYEGLCVGHGGYRKCLSLNCGKKALPSGCCLSHGGNSRCRVADCGKKALPGGFCTQHKGLASPQQHNQSQRQVGVVSHRHRPARRHQDEDMSDEEDDVVSPTDGTTWPSRCAQTSSSDELPISPLMPSTQSVPRPQLARDWSRAIVDAARKDPGTTHQPPPVNAFLQRMRDSSRAHLPTVEELRCNAASTCGGGGDGPRAQRARAHLRASSVSPLRPATGFNSSRPSLPPLGHFQRFTRRPMSGDPATPQTARSKPIGPSDSSSHTNSRSSTTASPTTCCVVTCTRFAKVSAMCLIHHHLHGQDAANRRRRRRSDGQYHHQWDGRDPRG